MMDTSEEFFKIVDPEVAKSIVSGEERIGFAIQVSVIPNGLVVEALDAPFYGYPDKESETALCSIVETIINHNLAADIREVMDKEIAKFPPERAKFTIATFFCNTWMGDDGVMMWRTDIKCPQILLEVHDLRALFFKCQQACQKWVLQI